MIRIRSITALLSLVVPAAAGAQPATLFRGARVFDGERVHASTDVLVRDGRIAAIGGNLTAPAGATSIQAHGMTLLPGLIDAHTHAFADALREALMFGVTTELDMFTQAQLAQSLRAEQARGAAAARADIFSAGTLVTAPGGHGTEYGVPIPTITRADSAQAFVDARIAEGSDWIKVVYDDGKLFGLDWPTLDLPTLRAVIDAAHRRDRLAVVHISTAQAAREALAAGADGLVHLYTDTGPAAELAALAKANGAFVIPTLVVLKSITGVGGAAPLADDARLASHLTPASAQNLRAAFPASSRPGGPRYENAVETVRALHAAGVPILAGTDAPNPGTAHGVALHRELELLVEAGLTPTQALAAATGVAAATFGLDDRGRIAEGLRADLLLVRGDPTADITATRDIEGVWKGGVRADRAAYAALVAAQRKAAEGGSTALATGALSDFEDGQPTAAFGTTWVLTTDSYAGGRSTGEVAVVDGGASGSAKSLRLTGTIDGAVPYAWSGAMWSPGAQPMQAGDLSARQGVEFRTRGDGRAYRVLVFTESQGFTPLVHEFTAPAAWTDVYVPWSALGIDGRGVMALMFVGGPQPGEFAFQVDDVRLR